MSELNSNQIKKLMLKTFTKAGGYKRYHEILTRTKDGAFSKESDRVFLELVDKVNNYVPKESRQDTEINIRLNIPKPDNECIEAPKYSIGERIDEDMVEDSDDDV